MWRQLWLRILRDRRATLSAGFTVANDCVCPDAARMIIRQTDQEDSTLAQSLHCDTVPDPPNRMLPTCYRGALYVACVTHQTHPLAHTEFSAQSAATETELLSQLLQLSIDFFEISPVSSGPQEIPAEVE